MHSHMELSKWIQMDQLLLADQLQCVNTDIMGKGKQLQNDTSCCCLTTWRHGRTFSRCYKCKLFHHMNWLRPQLAHCHGIDANDLKLKNNCMRKEISNPHAE